MRGTEAFAGFIKRLCLSDEFEGFKVINRVVKPEGANCWAIVVFSNHQNVENGLMHGLIILG